MTHETCQRIAAAMDEVRRTLGDIQEEDGGVTGSEAREAIAKAFGPILAEQRARTLKSVEAIIRALAVERDTPPAEETPA
jgi:hypothetical protein